MLVGTVVYQLPERIIAVRVEESPEFDAWLEEKHPGAVLTPGPIEGYEISAPGMPTLQTDQQAWVAYIPNGFQTEDPWFVRVHSGGFASYPAIGEALKSEFRDDTVNVNVVVGS